MLARSQFSTQSFHGLLGLGVLETSYISHGLLLIHIFIVLACGMLALHTVYKTCGYLQFVQEVAGKSTQEATDEVCALLAYATKGEVSEHRM